MSNSYIEYGSPIDTPAIGELTLSAAQDAFHACESNSCYEIIELRKLEGEEGLVAEIIVADCTCKEIPSRNAIGILIRERVALTLMADESKMPEVRMLRKDFPVIPHCNHVEEGTPTSLCLYFEPWSAVRRTWTAQQFLQRVEWWLTLAAKKDLHPADQELEQIYFNSPYKVITPPNFKNLTALSDEPLKLFPCSDSFLKLFYSNDTDDNRSNVKITPILVDFFDIVHGKIERTPSTLAQLNHQIITRGQSLLSKFQEAIELYTKTNSTEGFIIKDTEKHTLLLLRFFKIREEGMPVERVETHGYFIDCDIVTLGAQLGILEQHPETKDKYFIDTLGGKKEPQEIWKEHELLPVEIKEGISLDQARHFSGINIETTSFKGCLVGLGALGSTIATLWSKEAWGEWTYIDSDKIEPHNIVRHIATEKMAGFSKAYVMSDLNSNNFYPGESTPHFFDDNVLNSSNKSIQETIQKSDLLVDASTTLEVPREISQLDNTPRSASIFLTPSGDASVLLLEDSERKIRLTTLESQYYRAILTFPWGEAHLKNHKGHLAVGLGCRDVSLVMSYEKITLHSAILAQQVRVLRDQTQPKLKIWISDDENSEVQVHDIPISPVICCTCGNWEIVLDDYLVKKLNKIRHEKLPTETGGIILGYADHILNQIFVVDICPAPIDSEEKIGSFIRGCQGLPEVVDSASDRTANVVGYIGEWHSHPQNHNAIPSAADQILIGDLSKNMWKEGRPALMLIVGENNITITVKVGAQKWTTEI